MLLIDKNLRYGFNRFTHGFFQVGFADAFCVNINVAIVKIIALIAQLFRQLFGANALGAAWTTKNYRKHSLSP